MLFLNSLSSEGTTAKVSEAIGSTNFSFHSIVFCNRYLWGSVTLFPFLWLLESWVLLTSKLGLHNDKTPKVIQTHSL